jgi:uncharacterized DUF497 family protein
MNAQFEWDPEKAEANFRKHVVTFAEGATVFFDPLSLTVPDPLHSDAEDRFVVTGLSQSQRHLVVVHVDRGQDGFASTLKDAFKASNTRSVFHSLLARLADSPG